MMLASMGAAMSGAPGGLAAMPGMGMIGMMPAMQLPPGAPIDPSIPLRTVFVGDISMRAHERDVLRLLAAHGEIESVFVPREAALDTHKGYLLARFTSADAVPKAVEALKAIQMHGKRLRVLANLASLAPGDTRSYASNRLYIGGLPASVTPRDLREIFEAFGPVRGALLVPSKPGDTRLTNYAFLEFYVEGCVPEASALMDGFELAGRTLKVSAAAISSGADMLTHGTVFPLEFVTNPYAEEHAEQRARRQKKAADRAAEKATEKAAAAAAAADDTAGNADGEEDAADAAAAAALVDDEAADDTEPSAKMLIDEPAPLRAVVLNNMVGPADVDEALRGEVAAECAKYGTVAAVKIVLDSTAQAVRVLVLFDDVAGAAMARDKTHGRMFAGRMVQASLASEADFDQAGL